MGKINAKELCQKLKLDAIEKQDDSQVGDLRLRVLDFFITRDVPDELFEELLEARINDPDPDKEQSKIICAEILEAWRTGHNDGL